MRMHENRLLAVFSKNPAAGNVKTRLASSIGNEKALEVYEMLRRHTAEAISGVHATCMIFYADFIPESDILLVGDAEARQQQGKDLGERMHTAFCEGLSSGARNIVLIGTDCPDISATVIEQAFELLENHDAVLGPAKDGGFYLIGLKRCFPELFLERTWSNGAVLGETIDRLESCRASFSLLSELQDIDTFEDLQQSRFRLDGIDHSPPG